MGKKGHFGTLIRDGKLIVGRLENGKVVGEQPLDPNEAVAFAAHLLNMAKSANSKPPKIALPQDGIVYDLAPGAISLAGADGGKQLQIVLWFGESGIAFPMAPEMAKELFGAVMAASAKGVRH